MRPFQEPEAATIAYRARKLLKSGQITHHQFCVLDALLYGERRKNDAKVIIAYSRIQRIAHVCRDTVAKAIARLQEVGLFRVEKRRLLVLWTNGGKAWRQLANAYVFASPHRESVSRGEKIQSTKILVLPPETLPPAGSAQEALAAVARRMEERLRRPRERIGTSDSHQIES